MKIIHIGDCLPDLTEMLRAAAEEGEHAPERLCTEWKSGANRFDRAGEVLLYAQLDARIVGIGGLTVEPADPLALRMRRFYVLPDYRRRGVATAMARRLIEASAPNTHVTVHAGTSRAAHFWEGLGFRRVSDRPYSHHVIRPVPVSPPRAL